MNKDIAFIDTQKQPTVAGFPTKPPANHQRVNAEASPSWHDRLVEGGLILSMALYYVLGNPNVHIGHFSFTFSVFHNSLASLPFLLIFAVLCWYRLPFAVALLPLSLPYYLQQKVVFSHYEFSLVEITLVTCVLVALLQILVQRRQWPYWTSLRQLRNRLGPFAVPMLLFFCIAAFSILIAYRHDLALRAFREEVFDPLVYVLLALLCLRTRQDVTRLIAAMIATGLVISGFGLVQIAFFKNTLQLENGVRRISAVYGSANSIGLLFDYILPIGFALLFAKVSLRLRLVVLLCCLPMLAVLYLTQSLGAWVAIALALLFVVTFSIHDRKLLLTGGAILVVVLLAGTFLFRTQITNVFTEHHTSVSAKGVQTVSTVTKRIYLWESALRMIHDSPWVGYGMDNWLCHYSQNTICSTPYHYWIEQDPVTHQDTGLRYEPFLSHPHNIFLHVWVSIGVFGLLAFIAILVLFFWLFSRIIRRLDANVYKGSEYLRWLTVGVGAAMFAALVQGQVDSAFLEQDLSFCFWILVTALLLLRIHAETSWRSQPRLSTRNMKSEP
jgi:O-antigen ligase